MQKKVFLILFSGLILLSFFFAQQITYQQNDEYTRYLGVENFLNSNFQIPDRALATIYTQLALGSVFKFAFPSLTLPTLSVIISILTLYLFYSLFKNKKLGILSAAILMIHPLYVYSSFTFMTEIYAIFFSLLICKIIAENKVNVKYGALLAIVVFLGFYTKQTTVLYFLGIIPPLLISKNYKAGFWLMVSILPLVLSLVWFTPTSEMNKHSLMFENLHYLKYTVSLSTFILVYLGYLLIPFLPQMLKQILSYKNTRKCSFIAILLLLGMYLADFQTVRNIQANLNPDFPFFQNVWDQNGLYTKSFEDTSYFKYQELFYQAIEILSSLSLVIFTLILLKSKSLFKNYYFWVVVLNVSFLLVTPKIYDRYILAIFPAVFLLFDSATWKKISFHITKSSAFYFCTFFLLGSLYSYNLFMKFHLENKYIWAKSYELINVHKVKPESIRGGLSFRRKFINLSSFYAYTFTHVKLDLKMLDIHEVSFPLKLIPTTPIYLYEVETVQ